MFINQLHSQEIKNKKIILNAFNPYKTAKEISISQKIQERLSNKLISLGYEVIQVDSSDLKRQQKIG